MAERQKFSCAVANKLTLLLHHVAKSVRYQLRNLSHIRKFLSRKATEQVVHSLISSRLDFCNSILINLPEYQLKRLQYLQNSAARLVTRSKSTSHISPILKELHWLPVHARINFKILLLVQASISSKQSTNIHTGPDTSFSTQTATFIKHQPASHPTRTPHLGDPILLTHRPVSLECSTSPHATRSIIHTGKPILFWGNSYFYCYEFMNIKFSH